MCISWSIIQAVHGGFDLWKSPAENHSCNAQHSSDMFLYIIDIVSFNQPEHIANEKLYILWDNDIVLFYNNASSANGHVILL